MAPPAGTYQFLDVGERAGVLLVGDTRREVHVASLARGVLVGFLLTVPVCLVVNDTLNLLQTQQTGCSGYVHKHTATSVM